jgi:hypothetical protein
MDELRSILGKSRIHGNNLIRLTRSLVKTLSINPPGDERGVSRVGGEELDSMGLDVEYVESKANRINTLGRLKGTGGGRTSYGMVITILYQ